MPDNSVPDELVSPAAMPALPGERSDEALRVEISAILSDTGLHPAEKRARLEALRDSAGETGTDEEEYAPLQTQVMHAIALLADGGHDYGAAGASGDSEDEGGEPRPPA